MVKFHHIRNKENMGKGGMTVAYEQQTDGTIAYALAQCHPNDNYNKSLGRAKSAGRLMSEKYRHVFKGTTSDLFLSIQAGFTLLK